MWHCDAGAVSGVDRDSQFSPAVPGAIPHAMHASALPGGKERSLAGRVSSVPASLSAFLIYQHHFEGITCTGTFHWQVQVRFLFSFCL